jgi:hypothetical protein
MKIICPHVSVPTYKQELAGMHRLLKNMLTFAACLAMSGCFLETMDASYATGNEVIRGGYLEKGWIPRWLPSDATDIRETHNIDSNVSELSFLIPGRSSVVLPEDCRPVEYAHTVEAYIRRRWWPSEQELESSYVFFQCKADAADYRFVGITKSGRRVLHWRTYAH